MENIEYPLVNIEGEKIGVVVLNGKVFNTPVKKELIHTTVVWQRNKARAGTHKALTKGEMEGGAKKPWKQKGTGRARAGSSTSPHWVGGAVAHGPRPRSYETRVSKSVRKSALTSILSSKVKENNLIVVDKLFAKEAKTKNGTKITKALGLNTKKSVFVIDKTVSKEFELSVRNIDKVSLLPIDGLNVYSIINTEKLIISKDGIDILTSRVVS